VLPSGKPDVVHNFMYRPPSTPAQLLLYYFVARELFIAHSLARNFCWYQSALWPEDTEKIPTLVCLCGGDSIVPARSVRRFLEAYKKRKLEECKGTGAEAPKLDILWFPHLGHGELNFGPAGDAATAQIVERIFHVESNLDWRAASEKAL